MLKVLLVLILLWLLYRLARGLLFISRATRSFRNQTRQDNPATDSQQPSKLIPKDEGEYVDFEEIEPGSKS